ncbi:coiled-coil domain-containing protein 71L [Mustelus asterias]
MAVFAAEERVVYSRSQMVFAGTKALEDALKIFMPKCSDFHNSELELWDFLCSMREEGFSPLVLRSKDVYGYSSCRSTVPEAKPAAPPLKAAAERAPGSRRQRQRNAGEPRRRQGCLTKTSPSQLVDRVLRGTLSRKSVAFRLATFPSIKVEDSSSDESVSKARQRAQKILKVNLSPVIRLRPVRVP